MAPDSSIFNSEGWRTLWASFRESREAWIPARVLVIAAFSALAVAYAVLNPNDFIQGRFAINADIRAAHHPAEEPFSGKVETTEDGLHFYPSTLKPVRNILVVGDSTSYWSSYPRWIEKRSIRKGERWAVYTAARGGAMVSDIADTLAYVLANNNRKFDVILAKPSAGIMWNLVFDPRDAYRRPPIGSGSFLPHSGAPFGATRTSFFDHFRSTYRRRCADFAHLASNKRMERCLEYSRARPDAVFTTEIPREAKKAVERLGSEYEKGLMNLVGIAKMHETPIVFLTTHRKPHHPNEPAFHDGTTAHAAYKGKYLLAGFQHRIVDLTNEILYTVCLREGLPLIDSADYLASLPQKDLFLDAFHIQRRAEEGHGKFIYERLEEWGF